MQMRRETQRRGKTAPPSPREPIPPIARPPELETPDPRRATADWIAHIRTGRIKALR